ncbi:MAG: hypothetical protein KA314_29545 [Chloroflexi bacterium]|nr:hypothetical protein [Chloroflexota bacterium]MBP8060003.1 hypothetical protein [Chloroflexota bacterium]
MNREAVRYLSEDQLIQKALETLMRALGPMETTRFLSLAREGRVESVARHQQWQQTLEQNTFFDQVFGKIESMPTND